MPIIKGHCGKNVSKSGTSVPLVMIYEALRHSAIEIIPSLILMVIS